MCKTIQGDMHMGPQTSLSLSPFSPHQVTFKFQALKPLRTFDHVSTQPSRSGRDVGRPDASPSSTCHNGRLEKAAHMSWRASQRCPNDKLELREQRRDEFGRFLSCLTASLQYFCCLLCAVTHPVAMTPKQLYKKQLLRHCM